jgi:hypothetical protein
MKKFADMMFTAANGEQFWITSELQESLYKAMARCLLSTDLFQSPASQRDRTQAKASQEVMRIQAWMPASLSPC